MIMGRAVGPGRLVRPGSGGRVGGRRKVIIGRALGARYPLRSNGFPESAAARALVEGAQVIMGRAAGRDARCGRARAGVSARGAR